MTKTAEELESELNRLKQENESLKKKGSLSLSMKVSEKGALSVYGLGRFPVTLYKDQWAKLLNFSQEIEKFIRENDSKLKEKVNESNKTS